MALITHLRQPHFLRTYDQIIRSLATSPASEQASATLSYIHTGQGSVLSAILPTGSSILVSRATCSVLARSDAITSKITLYTDIINALRRKLAGGPFSFYRYSSSEKTGDMVLSSRDGQNVAFADITPKGHFNLAIESALFCVSGDIQMKSGHQVSPLSHLLQVSGKGILAFSSSGRMVKIELNPGESFVVNKKFVLAFDSNIEFGEETQEPIGRLTKTVVNVNTTNYSSEIDVVRNVPFEGTNPAAVLVNYNDDPQYRSNDLIKASVPSGASSSGIIYLQSNVPQSLTRMVK